MGLAGRGVRPSRKSSRPPGGVAPESRAAPPHLALPRRKVQYVAGHLRGG